MSANLMITGALAAGDTGSNATGTGNFWDSILQNFPDFFDKVVKTTTQGGPLAVVILLLLILGLAVYGFRKIFFSNRVFGILGGVFALCLGGMLLYFMYEAFQTYMKRQSIESIVFMQGTLTYENLPDLERDGDLRIEMLAFNVRKIGGETQQHAYMYDEGFTAKKILATAKPDRIELTIRNRPLYNTCTEDKPSSIKRSLQHATKYIITFQDHAYLASGDSGTGFEQYGIDFGYSIQHGDLKYDFLSLDKFKNIDPNKVSVTVTHSPDKCIDNPNVQYAEIIKRNSANSAVRSLLTQIFLTLGDLIFPSAFSQQAPTINRDEIVKLLGATDLTLVTKAKTEISQRPADYAALLANLLHQRGEGVVLAQLNALTALKGASPKAFKLEDSLTDIIELSYVSPFDLRQAARSYLTDPDIVEDSQKTLAEIYPSQKAKAKQLTPNQYGLFLVSAREIYYVGGVNQLVNYVGDWGNRDRVPNAIEPSLRDFQAGIDVIADVPNEIVVPFAKSYYGKALALRSKTAVNAVIAKLGANATSKQIDKQVTALVEQRAPLPFTDAERGEFLETINKFLKTVDGREREYLWPDHIKSLKKCREQATYDCLHSE